MFTLLRGIDVMIYILRIPYFRHRPTLINAHVLQLTANVHMGVGGQIVDPLFSKQVGQ